MKQLIGYFVVLLAVTQIGCATAYIPKAKGHIAFVRDGSSAKVVKDGQVNEGGILGVLYSGIDNEVRGVPEAEAQADKAQGLAIGGTITTLVGLVGVIAGVVMVATADEDDSMVAPIALLGGGLVVDITGGLILRAAPTHFFNAINIYNDSVDASQSNTSRPVALDQSKR